MTPAQLLAEQDQFDTGLSDLFAQLPPQAIRDLAKTIALVRDKPVAWLGLDEKTRGIIANMATACLGRIVVEIANR